MDISPVITNVQWLEMESTEPTWEPKSASLVSAVSDRSPERLWTGAVPGESLFFPHQRLPVLFHGIWEEHEAQLE